MMDISIGPVTEIPFINTTQATQPRPAVNTTFDSFLNAAMDIINETNAFQIRAEQLQTDLATGKTDDILSVLLAQDRAFSSLNFTVQVTNKIIESYREIMRMQM
jgi:flagellar hook-basal body complex protein FliE